MRNNNLPHNPVSKDDFKICIGTKDEKTVEICLKYWTIKEISSFYGTIFLNKVKEIAVEYGMETKELINFVNEKSFLAYGSKCKHCDEYVNKIKYRSNINAFINNNMKLLFKDVCKKCINKKIVSEKNFDFVEIENVNKKKSKKVKNATEVENNFIEL